jgi:hypothetical protein
MNWPGTDPVSGEPQTTLPDALTALNAALEDDAADEVCPLNANVDLPDTAAQDSASKSNNPAVSG